MAYIPAHTKPQYTKATQLQDALPYTLTAIVTIILISLWSLFIDWLAYALGLPADGLFMQGMLTTGVFLLLINFAFIYDEIHRDIMKP
jgi:hypothetical protein